MSVKINYSNKSAVQLSTNTVIFVDEKFNTKNIAKYVSNSEISYINDLLKISDLKKNILIFELNSKKKIVLVSIKKNIKNYDIENLGAEFYSIINHGKNSRYFINSESVVNNYKNFIGHFLHGMKLKSYDFTKYKTKKEKRSIDVCIIGKKNNISLKDQLKFQAPVN